MTVVQERERLDLSPSLPGPALVMYSAPALWELVQKTEATLRAEEAARQRERELAAPKFREVVGLD